MTRWTMIMTLALVSGSSQGLAQTPPSIAIGGRPVPLAELLRHAEDHAPAVRVSMAEIDLSDADAAAAAPLLPSNPELLVGVGPRFVTGDGGGRDLNVLANLLVPLEIGGERRLRREVARSARRTRERSLDAVRWDTRVELTGVYRQALVLREDAALAAELERFYERLRSAAVRRVEAGDAAPLTRQVAEADAARARQARIAAVQRYREACLRLAALAGWSAEHPPEPRGELPQPRLPPPLSELVARALEGNPRLGQGRAAVAEARSREALASRDGWPEPAIGVRYVYEGAPGGGDPEHVIMGLLSLPFPVAQRNQVERSRSAARTGVVVAELEGLEAALAVRLAEQRSAVAAGAERVRAFGEGVLPAFAASLAELERAFTLGEIDLVRLSFAVERFIAARREALDAHAAYVGALAGLEALLGEPVWPDERRNRRAQW